MFPPNSGALNGSMRRIPPPEITGALLLGFNNLHTQKHGFRVRVVSLDPTHLPDSSAVGLSGWVKGRCRSHSDLEELKSHDET